MSGRVQFTCDGVQVEVDAAPGETLLSALREHLGIVSPKDGCAPQGQCGCCTVLVDGAARVACVTPLARIAGREVTTVNGLAPDVRDAIAAAFVATGGAQCGFCTPGIVVRAAALRAKGAPGSVGVDRALAAHLCRCTGWRTIIDAITETGPTPDAVALADPVRLDAASARAELEGGVGQTVGMPRRAGRGRIRRRHRARVRRSWPCRCRPGARLRASRPRVSTGSSPARCSRRASWRARCRAGARPLTRLHRCPLPDRPDGGVRLATSWVEPAYLEPDASVVRSRG